MKFFKGLLKVFGVLMILAGAVLYFTGYLELAKDFVVEKLGDCKCCKSEYDDYADDECEPQ